MCMRSGRSACVQRISLANLYVCTPGTFLLQTLIARQSTDEWKRFPAAVSIYI